jgi:chromosome segregation ATPase
VLQTQASDIATEKATLKDSHLALQRRQQDVQAQRSSLDAQSALLQVQSEQLNTALQQLNLSQQTWEAQYHDESRLLDDRQKVQHAREAEITAELLRLKGLQTQHETDQQALAKQSEALASQEQTLSQRQAQIQAQEQRLTQLYQEFQTHQERFFGLADQLQSRMALLEKRQTSQTEQSESMALRLAQLEQINASLLATTPSEDAKKKTK